jgi:hypothetical protein
MNCGLYCGALCYDMGGGADQRFGGVYSLHLQDWLLRQYGQNVDTHVPDFVVS